MSFPERARVLVVGDSGVGKTSLTSLIAHGTCLPSPGWTVGCSGRVDNTGHEITSYWCPSHNFFSLLPMRYCFNLILKCQYFE